MGFLLQTWTLICKNILIAVNRHAISTPFRALILPVAFMIFLSFAKNIFIPPSTYGIGTTHPILGLEQAVDAATGGRNTIVFVDSGFKHGAIAKVISSVASSLPSSDKNIIITSDESSLSRICRSTVRGVTTCYGAAIFHSSPHEGVGGIWNYTLKSDWALGTQINVNRGDNDAEIYAIPLQHAIDFTIANFNLTTNQFVLKQLQSSVQEYTYTSLTPEGRRTQIREKFTGTIINILAVAFLVAFVGITYQLTGFQASERELEMSNLIEAMMPNQKRWQPQVARLLSYHTAFSIIYLPGWLAMGIIMGTSVFPKTSIVMILLFNVTAGLALASFSILGAAFFKKAQLSGITLTIITLLLGIFAQVTGFLTSGLVAILSLLFTPCAYVYFIIFVARYERQDMATDIFRAAPENPWMLPGIVLWLFLVIQIIVYPVLGAMVERYFFGTVSKGRTVEIMHEDALEPVQVRNFRKEYPPGGFFNKISKNSKKTVVAVNDLSLTARKGEILVLLGANGSGKSTTLDTIAGLNTVTSGSITVDGRGGIGIAPQKNVLWADLTVLEHIKIFNKLKATGVRSRDEELKELIKAVDLERKINSKAGTLSGGQQRKLQMGMMFTGGSSVCCVDEVSSGVDPLSRRKIWDILLAERGKRTILLTTHFLDEADLLADQIAVLSKGTLRAQGSAVELKSKLGGGFRVHLPAERGRYLDFEGFQKRIAFDQVTYVAADSRQAARLVGMLEDSRIDDYVLEGPTIEEVFLKLAEEVRQETEGDYAPPEEYRPSLEHAEKGMTEKNDSVVFENEGEEQGFTLLSGNTIGFARQAWVLFRKRFIILRRNYLPYIAAILLPVVASAFVTFLVGKDQPLPSCSPGGSVQTSLQENILDQVGYDLVLGPQSQFNGSPTTFLQTLVPPGIPPLLVSRLSENITYANTLPEFNSYVTTNFANVTPGAFFAGSDVDPPIFAWKGNNYDIYSAIFAQNLLNNLLTNISISTQYSAFDRPFTAETTKSLQLVVYFGLAMAAYPAFFALYPTVERIRGVRGLEYSNGVRPLPLWLAYIAFDWMFVLVPSIVAIVIFAVRSTIWYHISYLLGVFILYGMNSIVISYIVSLYAKTQLSAFAITAAGQAITYIVYLMGYLITLTYVSVTKIDSTLLIIHYTLSLIFPMGSLARSMLITLNIFSTTCVGNEIAPNPGAMNQYGSPILYLIIQLFILFIILLRLDSVTLDAVLAHLFPSKISTTNLAAKRQSNLSLPLSPSQEPQFQSGLVVDHLTKTFKSNTAVDDISFSVPPNEVFALLGPNGAGKSTTISMIRGDILPSPQSGNIYIESIPINLHLASARKFLGVCPQHDAMDTMTVLEHLRFYARVRGIPDVNFNVRQILRAVGLEQFKSRLAVQLSGGNKRKLSLGIALMGNPTVLLLDEPSSGMDAASKRIMWKTLLGVAHGRSILLTTHSMEEADALASRAGIMATRMLAMGDLKGLREEFGERYFVHCVCKTAPHTTDAEIQHLKEWVITTFGGPDDGVEIEDKTYHGQMRFSVPAIRRRKGAGRDSRFEMSGAVGSSNMRNSRIPRKPLPVHPALSQQKYHKAEDSEDGVTFASTPTLRFTPDSNYFFGNPPPPKIEVHGGYGNYEGTAAADSRDGPDTFTVTPTAVQYTAAEGEGAEGFWMRPRNTRLGAGEESPVDPYLSSLMSPTTNRFSVPVAGGDRGGGASNARMSGMRLSGIGERVGDGEGEGEAGERGRGWRQGALIRKLEEDKEMMGLEAYSVGGTGLDQVFLGIVGEKVRADEASARSGSLSEERGFLRRRRK